MWLTPVVAAVVTAGLAVPAAADLAAYVARPEPEAAWRERSRERTSDGEVIHLHGTSQVWKDVRWTHDLDVFVPARRRHPDLALLVVAAGTGDARHHAAVAEAAGVTVAVLGDVPNQPLLGRRWEDDLVAETFERYVETGDAEWPLLLPMTKAAVRAMDAVQAFDRGVRRFVVTGASKRGWTAWLAGAVDPRVAGIVPVVFDNLRFAAQLPHQLAVWGEYSERIGDYTARGLAELVDTPRGRTLVAAVDPWSHRARLATPRKLVVNGTNDPYWTVDAIRLYWDGLGGEKSVLYVPNGGHGIAGDPRVHDATVAFLDRVGASRPMPVVAAHLDGAPDTPALQVTVGEPPRTVRVWSTTAPTRDLRDARWTSVPAEPDTEGFRAPLPAARDRFVACFAEAVFPAGDGKFALSTPVEVLAPAHR